MGCIEFLIVLAMASLYFSIVPWCVGLDQLVTNIKLLQGFFKERWLGIFSADQPICEFAAIIVTPTDSIQAFLLLISTSRRNCVRIMVVVYGGHHMDYRVIDLRTVETAGEGYLTFFEGEHDLPFPIRRIYYIHGTAQGVQRGGHAHRALRQMLFCPYGSILIKLDDGREKAEVLLDRPEKGLILGNGLWREMLWNQTDSVLCVAASEYYDERDYIRNYDDFLAYVKQGEANE